MLPAWSPLFPRVVVGGLGGGGEGRVQHGMSTTRRVHIGSSIRILSPLPAVHGRKTVSAAWTVNIAVDVIVWAVVGGITIDTIRSAAETVLSRGLRPLTYFGVPP